MAITLNGTTGTVTPGLFSNSTFTGTYTDGTVIDYTTGLGRISVGTSDGLAFYNGGVGSTEVARFDASGNFGIGTSSPSSKLHVVSDGVNSKFGASTSTAASTSQWLNGTGGMYVGVDNSTGSQFVGVAYSGNIWVSGAYPLCFATNGAERARIDSSGNLYIGRTSGGGRLNVQGDTYLYSITGSAGTNAVKYNTSTGLLSYDTSSARYKDNIRNSIYGLKEVLLMRSTMFEYKDSGRTDVGFIAEELDEIIPELVSKDENGAANAVSYDRMVSVLVKAIQEIVERLVALENK